MATAAVSAVDDEEIVMTPLRSKHAGHRIIRVERVGSDKLNSDRVHYVAGGTYHGIVINKAVNVKPKKSVPHTLRRFTAHVAAGDDVTVKEVREIRFWFKSTVAEERRQELTEDLFKDLLNPADFPTDYTSFVKRVVRLVQIYLSVKNVELEMRPFTDDDEALDARGQPLMSSSSAPVTSSLPRPSAAVNVDNKTDDVTSPADDNTELATTQSKTRKKRITSRKSEATDDDVTPGQDNKVLGENYDLTIEASELTQHVTSSSRPTANDNDDDARVTSPVDDDVELLAVTKKKIRKKRKRSRKPEQTGEDITTEQIDKALEKDEVFQQVEEVVIRKQTAHITGLYGNPSYAAELGLRPGNGYTSRVADDDNDTQLTSPVDGDVEHATTTKKTGTKRSFRKSQEDGDDVTAEQVEKALEKDEVFQQVEEVVIRKQTAHITGLHGNPSYAAELGLRPGNGYTSRVADSDEIAQDTTASRRQKRRSGSATGTGSTSSNRKSSSSSDKMASKQQRLLATLEDAFPTALGVDDLAKITRMSREDVETFLNELSQSNMAVELEDGLWMRAQVQRDGSPGRRQHSSSSKRTSASTADARQHEFRMVTHVPDLSRSDQPTVAIIALLYCEKLAVDAMIDNKTTYIRCKKGGEGQVYTVGRIGKRRVVSTKLSRIGREATTNTATRSTVTRLLGTFNMIEHVFLVGVAGGVACFDDDTRHVRRGDVIVSKPAEPGGAIYMQIMSRDDDNSLSCLPWAARDPTLSDIAAKLLRKPKTFYKRLDQHITDGLSELCDSGESEAGRLASFRRPSADSDRLYTGSGKTETLVEHPPVTPDSRRDQRPEKPIVQLGVVATGAVRDHQQRQHCLDEYDVKVFDAGFQAVLESVEGNRKESFIVVRGVCDYGDGTSAEKARQDDTDWRPYSALAAAGVMKCIVLGIVAPSDDDDDND